MTKEPTIQEMNEVIARFDGWELGQAIPKYWNPSKNITNFYTPEQMRYHSDWKWLMPVIEKISKWPLLNLDGTPCTDPNDTCYPVTFNMPVPNEEGKVMFRFKGHTLHFGEKLIDVCFHAVYDAIQWYNQQTTKP